MICISVTPTSRTLAPADLLNASRKCDLIELCLDHFIAEPNVGELIKMVDTPMLVSCRREQDGGKWKGNENQRMQLLREAIVAGPAYVELDLEMAEKFHASVRRNASSPTRTSIVHFQKLMKSSLSVAKRRPTSSSSRGSLKILTLGHC